MSTATTTPAAQLAAALASLLSSSMGATVDGQVVTLTAGDRTFVMAIAEKIDDPLAHVTYPHRWTRDEVQHLGGVGGRDKCHERSPQSYVCNRVLGHSGKHIASYGSDQGDSLCTHPWGGDPVARGGDKYRDFKIDMQIDPADIGPDGGKCNDDNAGRKCVLAKGHSGVHITTRNRGRVTMDPWTEADKSDPFSCWSLTNRSGDPTEGEDEDDPCGHDIRGDECTRPDGHSGNHVSGSGYGVRDWCRPGECG